MIRDYHGNFISTATWKTDLVGDVEAAEAHAVHIGIELATLSRCFRVIVNSDSSDVLQAISSGSHSLSTADAIYEDCFSIIEGLSQFEISHCFR